MDIATLLTPLTYSVIGIVTTVFLVQFFVDIKRSAWQRQYRRLATASIRKHESRSFSAVIQSSNDAQKTIDLIEHLQTHHYSKLQVIVTVDPSLDKGVLSSLRRYQRSQKILALRIITKLNNADNHPVINRYANGEILVFIDTDKRLSHDFFTQVSLRFMDTKLDGLQVRNHAKLDYRLSSAFNAWGALENDMVQALRGGKTPHAIRRESYVQKSVPKVAYSSKAAMHSSITHIGTFSTLRPLITIVLIAAVLLSTVMSSTEVLYPIMAAVLAIGILLIGQLASTPGYSLSDRLNLILLVPMEILYAIISTLAVSPFIILRQLVTKNKISKNQPQSI